MPSSYSPSDAGAIAAMIGARIKALESQQQLTISNSQGLPIINIGLIPGSNPPAYGLQFVDPASGSERMRIGLLQSGEYGISYTDPAGTTGYLLPQYGAYASGPFSITSVPPVTVAGTPSENVWIGSSGDAIITISSFMIPLGDQGQIYVVVDSTVSSHAVVISGAASVSTASRFLLSETSIGTLTPNTEHNFTLAFASTPTSANTTFSEVSLVVQPV